MNSTFPDRVSARKVDRREGSSLASMMIVMFVISIPTASLMSNAIQEKNLTRRRVADIEARYVVESALELAMAKLESNFKSVQSITASTPTLALSEAEQSALVGKSKYVSAVRINSVTNKLLRENIYIDEKDPDTLLDPHRGTHVNVSEWTIEAEANVGYRGSNRTVKASQSFQVRESPFFTHAIFYNMDLEFHAGPKMVITGKVHSNRNIWLIATSSGTFFNGKISATDNIYIGVMTNAATKSGDSFADDWSFMTGKNGSFDSHNNKDGTYVWFNTGGRKTGKKEGSAYYAHIWDGYSPKTKKGSYHDSWNEYSDKLHDDTGFSSLNELYLNRFNSNVAVGSETAPAIRTQFLPPYIPEDGSGNGINAGYTLIEPLQPATKSGVKNPLHKGDLEREKIAYRAGVTFKVAYSPGGAPSAANAVRIVKNGGDRSNTDDLTDYYLIPMRTRRDNPHDMDSTDVSASPSFEVLDDEGNPVLDEAGDPVTETVLQTSEDAIFIAPEVVDQFARMRLYEEDASQVPVADGGMFEPRRKQPLDMLDLDIGEFKEEFVEPPDTDRFLDGADLTFQPSTQYNGVVYVEFPTSEAEDRPDRIVVAKDDYRTVTVGGKTATTGIGLQVSNAKKLPNPSYNADKAPGFTLATNAPLYVLGSYNADGLSNTGSSTSDSGEGSDYKSLAALAADAVTFLSDSFDVTKSKLSTSNREASFTEINAAIMSGVIPTNAVEIADGYTKGLVLSGGSHNFHRFLEDWGGVTFRYRGSLVSFFESEVSRAPWTLDYYNPPNREYGFYDVFGTGAQPPGTPMARTFFKLDFRFL